MLHTEPSSQAVSESSNVAATREELDRLITEAEAAALLGVSPRTMERWRLRRSDGPLFYKMGRAVRYSLSDLKAFRESSRRRSTSDLPRAVTA